MVIRRNDRIFDPGIAARVEEQILLVGGLRVILDSDLAGLYGVPTKRLNEQVKRNLGRFPSDFMFQLSVDEIMELNRSQFATGSQKHRDPRFSPFAFTEHGVIMAANVLNSQRAIGASVFVVRAFVRIRGVLAINKELAQKLGDLERRVGGHDTVIRELVSAIRRLAEPPPSPPRRRIGFHPPGGE